MCIGYLMLQNTESGEPILLIFIISAPSRARVYRLFFTDTSI